MYYACFDKCISKFIMDLFGLEIRFQNITFHDHFNNFLAKYNFPCHNDQNLVNVVTFFISHRIFCCFVYHKLWSKGHRSREIFKSTFIERFHWNYPGFIWLSSDSLGGFSETSEFLAVFLKPWGGFRARIWPKMAKSKVSSIGVEYWIYSSITKVHNIP